MTSPQEWAKETFNAAADLFDHPANSFWSRFGTETVRRLNLQPGEQVLDVASGTGASAIPAAELVGPKGHVVAVDLAEELLAISAAKAAGLGLDNVEHLAADMTTLVYQPESFDAVVSVFGVFFAPDMDSFVSDLWRMIRNDGRLALTTWGPDLFEPIYSEYETIVGRERPDLVSEEGPWDHLQQPEGLAELLDLPGAVVETESVAAAHPISEPEDWWRMVMGSGLRGAVTAMGEDLAERVRIDTTDFVRDNHITEVTANVVYGVAVKSSG